MKDHNKARLGNYCNSVSKYYSYSDGSWFPLHHRDQGLSNIGSEMMYPVDTWNSLTQLLISLDYWQLPAGLIAVPIMKHVGKGMLRLHAAIPLQQMVLGVIVFVVALVWFSTGMIGIGVLLIGTLICMFASKNWNSKITRHGNYHRTNHDLHIRTKFDAFGFI